jgi:hypothetical protein
MLKRDNAEVQSLYCRPQHPIGFEASEIAFLEFLLRTTTLHDGHTRQETAEIYRGEDSLIGQDSSCDGGSLSLKIDPFLQELIPLGSCGSKDSFLRSAWQTHENLEHSHLLRKGPYALIVLDHDLQILSSPRLVVLAYRQRQTAPESKRQRIWKNVVRMERKALQQW